MIQYVNKIKSIGVVLQIGELEIDGEFRKVLTQSIFQKGNEFRAVISVDVKDNKIALNNIGRKVVVHGMYHGEIIKINSQRTELLEDRGDIVSICVCAVQRDCKREGCKGVDCEEHNGYLTVINDVKGCSITGSYQILSSNSWSFKHHSRLAVIMQDYVDVSGNDMRIEKGFFILHKNSKEIKEPVELSKENLKKKNLSQTGMMLRRIFFEMVKKTKEK